MKYKVGDKVKVRSNLKAYEIYGSNMLTKSMEKFAGKTVTISGVGITSYAIKEMEVAYWTDEMLEPVEEMSAEEATKILGKICCENECFDGCPISKAKGKMPCQNFRRDKAEEVIEILKQWKKDREKKPIEMEFIWYLLVVEEKTHIVKYEKPLKIERERTTDEQKEELLREWCSEHDGKYYATDERRCVVKE
ncbi:hypothetical protein [Dorea longicatena]|uniref:hypothetical protein n=1 Tax=Dorea longicatena TaxID=88431 RepID=UPI0034A49AE8